MAARVTSEAVENISKTLNEKHEIDGCALQQEVQNLRFGEKYQAFVKLQEKTAGKDARLTVHRINTNDQIGFVVDEATKDHPEESPVFVYVKDKKDDSPPKAICRSLSTPPSNTWLHELDLINKIDD